MQTIESTCALRLASLTRDLLSNDERSRANAYRDMLELAENGDGKAMFQVARCLNQGIGVEPDSTRADHWLRLACVAKPASSDALFTYGMSHVLKQRAGADTAKGIKFIERAASAGYVKATIELVKIVEHGLTDIKPDLRRAYRLLANSLNEQSDQELYTAYLGFVERHQPITNLLDS
ncbi:sel1 repeat family protein [Pseudomonas sp. P66]|uniref:Sel1 repeat family protein n=1 Tax=Pseudomonas arcuscaelestis TaxID=2710591 RepID=A0ABS2BZD8_9PSED|nr:SEL1-like repeat protein [Pseudomonas arcuscaelestis]MBM5459001.1 sel1 repeat family protein [Pseudomonas arcuscaelestis]